MKRLGRARAVVGAMLACGAFGAAIIGRPHSVSGQSADSSSGNSTPTDPGYHDPSQPWELGPGAIPYDQLSPQDQAGVEQILQTEDQSQPASSYQVFAAAANTMAADAQAQIAARSVGLSGTDNEGVVQ